MEASEVMTCMLCEDSEEGTPAEKRKLASDSAAMPPPPAVVPAPKEVDGACLVKLYEEDGHSVKICDGVSPPIFMPCYIVFVNALSP